MIDRRQRQNWLIAIPPRSLLRSVRHELLRVAGSQTPSAGGRTHIGGQGAVVSPCSGHGEFVARDVEGCPLPTVCRLNFDETLTSVRLEAGDIEAVTIAVLDRGPAHLLC